MGNSQRDLGAAFEIPMRPFPKARPRQNRQTGHTHMPRKYQEAREHCASELRVLNLPCITGPVSLTLIFQYSKGPFSDVDNLAGGFMDAANGILWQDDKQVSELHIIRRKGDADAIIFTIEEYMEGMK